MRFGSLSLPSPKFVLLLSDWLLEFYQPPLASQTSHVTQTLAEIFNSQNDKNKKSFNNCGFNNLPCLPVHNSHYFPLHRNLYCCFNLIIAPNILTKKNPTSYCTYCYLSNNLVHYIPTPQQYSATNVINFITGIFNLLCNYYEKCLELARSKHQTFFSYFNYTTFNICLIFY